MSENKYRGETLSFWQLLSKQKIEIPIIQRDYAQGRKDKKEIRDNFLNALFNSLNDSKAIRLDFIYGSIEDNSFQPLDGQQRLTTLFLLHWYAAIKDEIPFDDYANILKKFTYQTRISSRDFCETLISNPIDIKKSNEDLRSLIIDSAWFFLSWKKDPTIDAMLRTINDIHQKFLNVEKLWHKLTSNESLIDFYHVDLENIGLTDDLYIKMNARGKLLSPFENFKASFQKLINENNWELNTDFLETFACKIDTVWTDLFWNHRKQNTIDEAFIRFIATVVMIRKAIEKSEDRQSVISKLQENPNSVKPEMFSKESFEYIIECFDLYSKLLDKPEQIKIQVPFFQHNPEDTIFSSIVYEGQNASYTQKVLFYAQTEYLRRNSDFEDPKFQEWMRVIRNIICRGDVTKNGDRPAIIRSPQTFDGVISLISDLANGAEDIYKFLSTDTFDASFAKEQIKEESLKAELIEFSPLNKNVLFLTEDTNLLQGKIDFAFYCIDYNGDVNSFDSEALKEIQEVIKMYFNKDSDITNELRRALLTISDENGNYNYYGYWWSFWNVVSANKRCLIDKFRELEYYIYGRKIDFRIYIKKLIHQLIENNLSHIISNFNPPENMPNWKVRLIKDADLLDNKSKSNYIAIPEDESCCYLLKSMRPRDIDGCVKIE
jgi:hypothetical protein